MDGAFIVWEYEQETLYDYLHQHININFSMEIEDSGMLPFLEVLVKHDDNKKIYSYCLIINRNRRAGKITD